MVPVFQDGTDKELEQLRRESELPIEDLLHGMPPEVLTSPAVVAREEGTTEMVRSLP